jgi:hypothetical protein
MRRRKRKGKKESLGVAGRGKSVSKSLAGCSSAAAGTLRKGSKADFPKDLGRPARLACRISARHPQILKGFALPVDDHPKDAVASGNAGPRRGAGARAPAENYGPAVTWTLRGGPGQRNGISRTASTLDGKHRRPHPCSSRSLPLPAARTCLKGNEEARDDRPPPGHPGPLTILLLSSRVSTGRPRVVPFAPPRHESAGQLARRSALTHSGIIFRATFSQFIVQGFVCVSGYSRNKKRP